MKAAVESAVHARWAAVLLALAGVSGWTSPALAAPDSAVAVLGVEASEGAPDALASSLTDALRQRVSSTKGFRLVPGRDLVEVKLVFSCPDEAPSCMAQAGKSLGASKLIFGSVKRSAGEYYVVTLKLLDTTRGIVDAWVAEQVSRAQTTGPALRGPVQKWFATLTGQGGAGTVRVRCDVIGASVALDGTPSGLIGTEDFPIPGITPGKHEITVTKLGYEAVRKEVIVASGESTQVDVSLPRSAGNVPVAGVGGNGLPGPRGEDGRVTEHEGPPPAPALKTATWAVLGAGVVGIALGVKFGLDVQKINTDLDPWRRFSCGTDLCDIGGHRAAALTPEQAGYVKAKKDDGRRLETYQYISYGVGGALILAGGYLLYRAYLQDDGEVRSANHPRIATAVTPVLAPGQVGVAAAFAF